MIEKGRESCGTAVPMSLRNNHETPLHCFAFDCSDLSLTKTVLREHPPSLTVPDLYNNTPLQRVESHHGSYLLERNSHFHHVTFLHSDNSLTTHCYRPPKISIKTNRSLTTPLIVGPSFRSLLLS